MRAMIKRMRRKVGWGLAAGFMLVGIVWLALPRDTTLVGRATLVKGWPERGREYDWETDHSVILYVPALARHSALRLDTTIEQCVPLSTVTLQLEKTPYSDRSSPWKLSPNGKRLFHRELMTGNGWEGSVWVTTNLAGGNAETGSGTNLTSDSYFWQGLHDPWFKDSRHWVEMTDGAAIDGASATPSAFDLIIHDAEIPETVRRAPISIPPNKNGVRPYPFTLLGFTPQGRGIVTYWMPGAVVPMDCWEFGIEPNAAPPRPFRIPLPTKGRVDELALSPQADRLVWRLYCERESSVMGLLQKLFPRMELETRRTVEFWVSRLDGREPRCLGTQPAKPDYLPGHNGPGHMRWTPDGKRVSFLYQSRLYTIPAEG